MTVYAGEDAVSALAAEAKKADVTGFAASGQTITLTFGDGSTKQVTTQDTTYTAGAGIAISNTGVISQSGTVYHFMGSCAVANLPASPSSGDVWNLTDSSSYGPAGTNVAWTGSAWDAMGGVTDVPVQSVSGTAPISASTSNKAVTVSISAATTSAAGSMSAADKTKLNGIATGAQVNVIESVSGTAPISASTSGKAVTVSIGAASGSAAGSMSSAHYTKLEGIASGAEVNQNAFSNVKVGSTTIAADAKTDTLTIVAGSNVTLTPDATNDKLTIAATDTTYSAATTSAAGLMSAADKTKLDGIAEGANAYTHPSYTAHTSGLYKIANDASGHVSGATAVQKSDITALGIPAQDTTYSAATTSAAGLMSASDKTKLDGIASGAEANQNAFGNVKVGSTTVAADSETDTLEIVAGDGISLVGDATNDKVTVAAKISVIEGIGPITASYGEISFVPGPYEEPVDEGDHYGYTIEHAASGVTAASKGDTSNQTPGWGSTFKVTSGTVNATGHLTAFADHTVKIPNSTATTSAAGLMSTTQVTKLNGIATGATADTAMTAARAVELWQNA